MIRRVLIEYICVAILFLVLSEAISAMGVSSTHSTWIAVAGAVAAVVLLRMIELRRL